MSKSISGCYILFNQQKMLYLKVPQRQNFINPVCNKAKCGVKNQIPYD